MGAVLGGADLSQWSARGRLYNKLRTIYLLAFSTCWICGHGGADEVDHVVSPRDAPELALVVDNWRPAHGPAGCPDCGRKCNQERGLKPVESLKVAAPRRL